MAHTCNPSTAEAEAGSLQGVTGQPGLQSRAVALEEKTRKECMYVCMYEKKGTLNHCKDVTIKNKQL